MKVLMVGAGDPPSTFIQRQIDILQSKNVEVSIFPGFNDRGYLVRKLVKKSLGLYVPKEIRKTIESADLLHFQWPSHWIEFGALARKFKKPAVLSLRGRQINILPFVPGRESFVRDLRESLPKCDAYHCVSQNILEVATEFGLCKDRARVIRPAVDTAFFAPSRVENKPQTFRIAMVGALVWRKGYEYALLALKDVLARGHRVDMFIVGDGEDRERIEYTIRDLALTDQVRIVGKQTPQDVAVLLKSSHLLLHASVSEGIANVVLEAMSCGTPVIAFEAGGLAEAVRDGVDGFLIPVRVVDSMAGKISLLINDDVLRRKMASDARARAVEDFDIDKQGDSFVALYESLLRT
jgi:colanic acid/amylovoran biosynthesis glycosyltransferase